MSLADSPMQAARYLPLAIASVMAAPGCVVEHWGTFAHLELEGLLERLGPMEGPLTEEATNVYASDAAAAALGQLLFFDPGYSANGKVACATCHDPETGFQDARANTSLGLDYTGRHTPSCLFAGATPDEGTSWMYWDGRRDSLWSQALGPPESDVEMGGSRSAIAYMIYDRYRAPYESVFGPMPALRDEAGNAAFPLDARPGMPAWDALAQSERDDITAIFVGFGKALEAYERQLVTVNSPFDRFWADASAGLAEGSTELTPQQKRGLHLFTGKANCLECHHGPTLSDGVFHNTGMAQNGLHIPPRDLGREDGIAGVLSAEFNCASRWSDHPEKTRCATQTLALQDDIDEGSFKTPSLRDVARTAPYMHTGEFDDLEQVVRFYNAGGASDGFSGNLDEDILPLELDEAEIHDLVAFLEALTGDPLPVELTTRPTLR
jgi:cytochrome c peroxidase